MVALVFNQTEMSTLTVCHTTKMCVSHCEIMYSFDYKSHASINTFHTG